MADINDYALNLSLNVDITSALSSLDNVITRLGDVDQAIRDAAVTMNTELGGACSALNTQVLEIANSAATINTSLQASRPTIQAINADIRQLVVDQRELNAQLLHMLETWAETLDVREEIETLNRSARRHWADERDQFRARERHWSNVLGSATSFIPKLFGIYLGWQAIKAAYSDLASVERRFEHATYTAYGSQAQLIDSTNDLTRDYDLLRDVSMEAMSSLIGQLRVPKEELGKLVALTSQFTNATGVSAGTTAIWARQMTLAGYSSVDMERRLDNLTHSMESAGFTQEEMTRIITDQTEKLAHRTAIYGEAGAEAMIDWEVRLLALVKANHGNVDAMREVVAAMVDAGVQATILENMGARLAKQPGWSDIEYKQQKRLAGVLELMKSINAQIEAGRATGQENIAWEAGMARWRELTGLSTSAYDQMRQFMEAQGYLVGDTSTAIANLNRDMAAAVPLWDESEALKKNYERAVADIESSTQKISDAFVMLWQEIITRAEPFIVMALGAVSDTVHMFQKQLDSFLSAITPSFQEWLATAGEAIGEFIQYFTDGIAPTTRGGQLLVDVWSNIKMAAGLLWFGIDSLIWIFGRLYDGFQYIVAAYNSFKTSFGGAGSLIGTVGAVILGVIAGIGGLALILWGIGTAARFLFTAFTPTAVFGLLAASVAMLSFAAAVFIVASSIKMLAELDRAAALPIVSLLALFAGFFIVAAIPGMAVALLATGAATLLFAGALYIAAKAIEIAAKSLREFVSIGATRIASIGWSFGEAALPLSAGIIAIGKAASWYDWADLEAASRALRSVASSARELMSVDPFGMSRWAARLRDFVNSIGNIPRSLTASAEAVDQAVPAITASILSIDRALVGFNPDHIDRVNDLMQEMIKTFRSSSLDLVGPANLVASTIESMVIRVAKANVALNTITATMSTALTNIATVIDTGLDEIQTQAERAESISISMLSAVEEINRSSDRLAQINAETPTRTDTISTVKLLTREEKTVEKTDSARMVELSDQQSKALDRISQILDNISKDDSGLNSIAKLLEEWLPQLAEKSASLGTKMNRW